MCNIFCCHPVGDIRCQMLITTRIPLPLGVDDGGVGPINSPGEMFALWLDNFVAIQLTFFFCLWLPDTVLLYAHAIF